MALGNTITATFEFPRGVLDRKNRGKVYKQSFFKLGRLWYEKMLPKHFTKQGADEYGYPPRTEKWNRVKTEGRTKAGRQAVAGDTPLVYTGELKMSALTVRDITGTSKGVSIKLRSLPPETYYRAKGRAVSNAEEIRRISSGDKNNLIRFLDRTLETEFKKVQGSSSGLSV